eukprot:8762474-Alexandrium_andersonii.AAC.1
MSASLVGSEMCIRDRVLACRRTLGVRRGRGAGAPPGGCHIGVWAGGCSCLLYTSDAADDM